MRYLFYMSRLRSPVDDGGELPQFTVNGLRAFPGGGAVSGILAAQREAVAAGRVGIGVIR